MLKNSSKACKEAAAVMTVWVRNTHQSLQRQEFRWEWVRQEVKDQKTEIQTLMVDAGCLQNNQSKYEERLKQLEDLVCKQERALVEQGRRWESVENERRLGGCWTPEIQGQGAEGRTPGRAAPHSDGIGGKIRRSSSPGSTKRQQEGTARRGLVAPQPQGIVIRRGAEIAESDPGRPGVSSRDSSRGSRGDSDSGSTPEAASSKGSEGLTRQALAGALGRPIVNPHQQGAGGAEGMLELSIVGTPSLLSSAQKSTTRAAVKRKGDTQTKVGEESRQSQGSGGGKKARSLENS